jgi:hypothetical protein
LLSFCSAAGATGGFAGGEKGLKQFIETGELKLRDPNAPGSRKQNSNVALAGLLVLAGAGGGLLLNEVTDLGESAFNAEVLQVRGSRVGLEGFRTGLD